MDAGIYGRIECLPHVSRDPKGRVCRQDTPFKDILSLTQFLLLALIVKPAMHSTEDLNSLNIYHLLTVPKVVVKALTI